MRVAPVTAGLLLLALVAASAIALATQDLDRPDLMTAWFLVVAATIGACLVLYRAWRVWPAASASLLVMRLDDAGPRLRKGRFRDETWFHVPWSSLQAVTFTPLPLPADAEPRLRGLRLFRFVPKPTADIPAGPPGVFDHLLRLPPRESVLAFVAASTWDNDLRELLEWVRVQRPGLHVEDTVPES